MSIGLNSPSSPRSNPVFLANVSPSWIRGSPIYRTTITPNLYVRAMPVWLGGIASEWAYDQEIVSQYFNFLIYKYCSISSSVLLWYDVILTFPTESLRIWRRKFTGVTLVYVLTRYGTAAQRIFLVLGFLMQGTGVQMYVGGYMRLSMPTCLE
ncbi:hypothetical protein GY45DRAFT_445488 [Cubamyces sp. BRFM 1775]|nr:hypothetical protein GY45DRAFT_445488 [Cubamyces sp. BRFM 1775]